MEIVHENEIHGRSIRRARALPEMHDDHVYVGIAWGLRVGTKWVFWPKGPRRKICTGIVVHTGPCEMTLDLVPWSG